MPRAAGSLSSWSVLLAVLAVIATLAIPVPVSAQRDTGVIAVRVAGPDGVPLPGVTVLTRGPVGTQTQYTGIDGSARFPGLYPGAGYAVTFTLDGFQTLVREGLVVSAARTVSIGVTLELSAVQEVINVVGESPVVDVRGTNVGGTYTDDMIDRSPTASRLWQACSTTRPAS